MEIDAQALINELAAQRNIALDDVAKLTAMLRKAQERINELEKAAAAVTAGTVE